MFRSSLISFDRCFSNKIPPRRMLETVPLGMLKKAKVKMKWDYMLHFGILYEISFGGDASVQIDMKCSILSVQM